MALSEHIIFSKETAWATWVTPALAVPLTTFSYSVGRGRIDGRYTGVSRGMYQRLPGAKEVSASLEMPLWSEMLGLFLRAAQLQSVTTSTPSGGTDSRDHAFSPGDGGTLTGLSMQAQWSSTQVINLVGGLVDKFTISAKTGEAAVFSCDLMAKDEAPAGGTWDYDGVTASPAIIASPTYFARTIRPYIFTDVAIVTGGTPSKDGTTKQWSIAAGTSQTKIESIEFSFENGAEMRSGLGSPCPHSVFLGDRVVTVKFDIDLTTLSPAFYTEYRAGSQVALQATFTGPVIEGSIKRKLVITLPLLDFDDAEWPEISGSKSARVRTVSATAVEDTTEGEEIGITVTDTQTAY